MARDLLGRRTFALALSVGALAPSLAAAQQRSALDELFARFASVRAMRCRFREEKRVALLRTPIVSEGTIEYRRPDRLVRRVTSPSAQTITLEAGVLRIEEGGRTESIDLRAQPVVRSFVETFTLLFAGDRAAVERSYRLEHAAQPDGAWAIALTPRGEPLDRFLRTIRFDGQGPDLVRLVMTEVSGDVATTTLTDVHVER